MYHGISHIYSWILVTPKGWRKEFKDSVHLCGRQNEHREGLEHQAKWAEFTYKNASVHWQVPKDEWFIMEDPKKNDDLGGPLS